MRIDFAFFALLIFEIRSTTGWLFWMTQKLLTLVQIRFLSWKCFKLLWKNFRMLLTSFNSGLTLHSGESIMYLSPIGSFLQLRAPIYTCEYFHLLLQHQLKFLKHVRVRFYDFIRRSIYVIRYHHFQFEEKILVRT